MIGLVTLTLAEMLVLAVIVLVVLPVSANGVAANLHRASVTRRAARKLVKEPLP